MLGQLSRQLATLRELTEADIKVAVAQLVEEAVPVLDKAEFLACLARKGETSAEIAAFVRELRLRTLHLAADGQFESDLILDVVGTGGDHLSTFNISTTVALIAAAAGVRVAKHGNRAATSLTGSADVMEALGIPFELEPAEAVRSLAEHNFVFFYAPKYHPAFRYIIPARKLCAERGQRTVFNFLGPLLNPIRPSAMLIGVPDPKLCEPLAKVLQSLGVRRAMVVCGAVPDGKGGTRYLDELSTLGPTTISEFYQERGLASSTLPLELFPLQPATLADLRGGDRKVNAAIIRQVLNGEERGAKRDIVLLNAAAALFIAEQAPNLGTGWEVAAELIDSGRARRKLEELATGTAR